MGYIFTLVGSAVSWKLNLQLIVALLSLCLQQEAEYMAAMKAMKAVKEAIWLKGLVASLVRLESTLRCDSQSAIQLIKKKLHKRTRYIDVRFHFIEMSLKRNYQSRES